MSRFRIIILNVLVYSFAFLYILPILWTVLASFKPESEIFSYPPKIISKLTLENYKTVLKDSDVYLYFKNSAIVALSSSAITVIISSMGGYALAKYEFKFKKAVSVYILSMLMIPLQVVMVSIYITLARLHMLNTLWGLIIPPAATPTGIFLAQKYISSAIPYSVIESARIDGADEFSIFWKIVLPMSKPLVASLAILSFTWRWNDFLWPLIVVNSSKLYTVQLALGMYAGQHITEWGELLAFTTLSMLPILLMFFLFQRAFVKGIATGAVKE